MSPLVVDRTHRTKVPVEITVGVLAGDGDDYTTVDVVGWNEQQVVCVGEDCAYLLPFSELPHRTMAALQKLAAPVHLAGAAPLRAGFVIGSVGRRRVPL